MAKGEDDALFLAIAVVLATAGMAAAQCGLTPRMELHLMGKYGEQVVDEVWLRPKQKIRKGAANDARASRRHEKPASGMFNVRLWLNKETTTWTVTVSDMRGNSCMLRNGRGSAPRLWNVVNQGMI